MSVTTDKNLKEAREALRSIKQYTLNIASVVVDYLTAVKDVNGNMTYSEDYKKQLNDGARVTGGEKVAASLDVIKAKVGELREATEAIITAGDVFMDPALSNALMIVSNSKDNGADVEGLVKAILQGFRGNFAALNSICTVAPDSIAKILVKETMTGETIEAATGAIIKNVETCENKTAHNDDLANVLVNINEINKTVSRLAPLYGETFEGMDLSKLALIEESYHEVLARKAMGLS